MNNDSISQVFYYLSKGVIGLALLVLVIGVVSRSSIDKKPKENLLRPTPEAVISNNSSKEDSATAKISAEIFNSNSSFVCQASSEASFKFYIKNKKVAGQTTDKTTIRNYVFDGDCLYIWKGGFTVGGKLCGLSQYLSIFSSLSGLGLSNINVTDLLKSVDKVGSSAAKIEVIAQTCKKKEIKDVSIFSPPKYINFQEMEPGKIME
jgi:hypothetical protein